jgi:hypothetical protein
MRGLIYELLRAAHFCLPAFVCALEEREASAGVFLTVRERGFLSQIFEKSAAFLPPPLCYYLEIYDNWLDSIK